MERITTISAFCAFCISAYATLQQDGITVSVSAFSQVAGPATAARNTARNNKQATTSSSSIILAAGGDFGELTSALATMDQQWQIQQRSIVGKPRWSKLFLPKDEEPDDETETETNADTSTNPFGSNSNSNIPFGQQEQEFVWMLEPPSNSIPSCIVVFTGGAGLGQFPQVAYNELLSKISNKLNAVCITAPYEVGLDHFGLAKQTGERIRKALLILNENENESENSSTDDNDSVNANIVRSRLPTYSLAHSLGCKLQTIYMAATGLENSFDGVGFMAYNNFSFAKTITMARSFAQELRGGDNNNNMNMGNMGNPEMMNSIFDFAEMAVGAIGVDFSPNSQDTERLIQLKYNDNLQAKTRMFVFDKDTLDSSQEFTSACDLYDGNNNNNNNLRVSNLSGGHLTPVYFQWNTDDLANEVAGAGLGDNFTPENINMAKEALGGFQGASFGDDEAFGTLVDEVCDWILGKPPSRTTSSSIPKISSSSSSSSA